MSEYAWICLNKQDSENVLSPKHAKILNREKFWIWQGSRYVSVTQHSEYPRICLDRVLNISQFQNMPGFWIWQGSEYAREQELHRVLNMPQYGWICLTRTSICLNMPEFAIIDKVLNMPHTINSVKSLFKLMSIV